MLTRTLFSVLSVIAVLAASLYTAQAQNNTQDYFSHAKKMSDEFDRIQAGIELVFDPSLFIGKMQNLNFEHKKFSEAYANRKERKNLSHSLEAAIFHEYMGLVSRIRNSEEVPPDVVNRVIDANQQRIALLKQSLKIEQDEGPKQAWVSVIKTSMEQGNYPAAGEYAKLAKDIYGNEREFRDLEDQIVSVIARAREDKAKAAKLIEDKKYREALEILEPLSKTSPDDQDVARMYESTSANVAKMDQLIADARNYEANDKLKEAFRTWEDLLEYDPANEEAKEKTDKYRKQLEFGTTEIVSTCENCGGHGYCNVCKGSGLCLVCNGYQKCIQCRGAGYFTRRCPYCICKSCQGTGLCTTCEGRGTVNCTACGGMGFIRTVQSVTCSVCRGTGKSRFNDRPCPACNGTGKTAANVDRICTVCRGAKTLPCPTCQGDGRCKTCNGRGHDANCSHCGGTGVLVTDCVACKRTGKCLECGGTGVCRFCKGSGKCAECRGTGIIVKKIDEEKYLDEKNHFISVISEPEDAQVFLDGELKGNAPIEIQDVAEGPHAVRISKQGYDDFIYKTTFTKNYAAKFNIKLLSRKYNKFRVLTIHRARHSLLFTNYQGQEGDSYMISLYIDGANEWKELGDKVLGYTIDSLKRELKSKFNPRLQETQVVDLSSVILTKPDGTETRVLKNNPMQLVVYKAKVYDDSAKRFVIVEEGSKLGDATVTNITDNEVVLTDKDGNSFTISAK